MEAYNYVMTASILVCFALIVLIILNSRKIEKKFFNNGICLDCKNPLERLNEEGARIRSYYCPECFSIISIFFRVDKNVIIKQNISFQEETEGENNENADSFVNSL